MSQEAPLREMLITLDSPYYLSEADSEEIFARINNDAKNIAISVMYAGESGTADYLAKGNVALTPTTRDVKIKKLPAGSLPVKKLCFYQFSGIVTTPLLKVDRPYFKRAIGNFLSFMAFPFHLVAAAWTEFFHFITGQGDPSSISRAWIGNSDLDHKTIPISDIHDALTPVKFLPSAAAEKGILQPGQSGLGIWIQPDLTNNRLIAIVDKDRQISRYINDQVPSYYYVFKGFTPQRILFGWLSNEYENNDGSCYGSFLYTESH